MRCDLANRGGARTYPDRGSEATTFRHRDPAIPGTTPRLGLSRKWKSCCLNSLARVRDASVSQLLKRIKIETLVDLENKIIGVAVAALAVAFLGHTAEAKDAMTIFHAGTGIALVIVALGLFAKFAGAKE